ncbi:glycosyltransferase family 2 protein [Croceivirga thetidis]|uniref:glycosyltransferase family 2 protein n=1 Tax=Croceivirga thetidis TaxID=2721623 RepID=UPI001B2FF4CF|nr:glycosyltransferase family 2 protein [Croceivirga thetidis]
MNTPSKKLSALVITYNEIGYIEKCINAISFADEIIVVDSYSTDGTFEYLENHPKVKAIQHPFENFTAQKSFAMNQATNDWILFVDADEVVSDKLQKEIKSTIENPNACEAYWFYRKFMFKDKHLRFSGWQTDKNHRLFRKSKVKFTDKKLVHESLEVDGSSCILNEKLTHFCYKNYDDYKGKMLKYGRLKAKEAFYKEKSFSYFAMLFRPAWKFFNHYIIRLGILDGKKGIIVCYLNALGVLERFKELKRLEKKNELTYFLVMP